MDVVLNCLIFGEDTERIFDVQISPTAYVSGLKKLIKLENANAFRDVDARDLDLYKVSKPYEELAKEGITSLDQSKLLRAKTKLESHFGSNISDDDLHILIKLPSAACATSGSDATELMTLNCWVHGQNYRSVFPVEISQKKIVGTLKKAIKNENPIDFRDVDAKDLNLYKVSVACGPEVERMGLPDPKQLLDAWETLSSYFPGPLLGKNVHIVVESPRVASSTAPEEIDEELDAVAELNRAYTRSRDVGSKSLTPSQSAKSKQYANSQSSVPALFDCRFAQRKAVDTVAAPIQLFHPSFAYFTSKAFDSGHTVPDDFVHDIRDLIMAFAAIHDDESSRRQDLTSLWKNILARPISFRRNSDNTIPDFVVTDRCNLTVDGGSREEEVFLIIAEEKKELGDGGSDPSTQAAFSYRRIVCQRENTPIADRCCFPTFMIASAGPYLQIMGGIYTTNCIVQRLTDFLWVPVHSTLDDDQFMRIARVLYVLKESVNRLASWYRTLKEVPPLSPNDLDRAHPRFLPSPDTYLEDGRAVKFEYVKPLEPESGESCVTYLAKTIENGPKDIVVKFVTSYGEDAHRKLAEKGFAPSLLYCGNIDVNGDMPSYGDLRLVVMGFIDGYTFAAALKKLELSQAKIRSDLHIIIKGLHDSGYVFGDLREPNVMVTKEGKLQLIDFDWAGEEGKVKYPVSISTNHPWHEEVKGFALIRKEHDIAMINYLASRVSE